MMQIRQHAPLQSPVDFTIEIPHTGNPCVRVVNRYVETAGYSSEGLLAALFGKTYPDIYFGAPLSPPFDQPGVVSVPYTNRPVRGDTEFSGRIPIRETDSRGQYTLVLWYIPEGSNCFQHVSRAFRDDAGSLCRTMADPTDCSPALVSGGSPPNGSDRLAPRRYRLSTESSPPTTPWPWNSLQASGLVENGSVVLSYDHLDIAAGHYMWRSGSDPSAKIQWTLVLSGRQGPTTSAVLTGQRFSANHVHCRHLWTTDRWEPFGRNHLTAYRCSENEPVLPSLWIEPDEATRPVADEPS